MSTIIHLDDVRGRDADEPRLSLAEEYRKLLELMRETRTALDGLEVAASCALSGLRLPERHADKLIDALDRAATQVETQWAKVIVAQNWGTP